MAGCLLITLPLELTGSRVYRRPGRLLFALGVPAAAFAVWDLAAIARGHWSFAPEYVTGWRLPGDIPVEELVFFVVIPICTLLTFETVRRLLPRVRDRA
jgi:lycopene cyclase domain-containing protein